MEFILKIRSGLTEIVSRGADISQSPGYVRGRNQVVQIFDRAVTVSV